MVIANRDINIIADMEGTTGVKLNNSRQKLRARFEIVKKLGQGTYGKVQLAINKESGEEVAIKTIKKAKIETDQDLVRIQREIQIMSSVQHPHIIHIYEVFENKEKIVLVMEYANGGELYDYLSYKKVLSELEARRLFRQIASAVYYCHRNKICHRDLKLENILMDDQGNAKIADFGLSNVFNDHNFLTTYCGSPLYASPEIVRGTPYYGPEVDCWSLGVLLYTLVYGAMPFDGSNFKKLVKQISDGDYYEPKKPSDASGLIRRMLDVSADKRSTIEDICSDWWVNLGYEECLHDVAEDLCRQLPVRLDYLLALAAPPADQQPTGEVPAPSEGTAVKAHNLDEIVPNGYLEEESHVRSEVGDGDGDDETEKPDVNEDDEEEQPARKHKLTTSVSQARRSTSAVDRKKPKTSEGKDNDVEEVREEGETEAILDDKEQVLREATPEEAEEAVDVERRDVPAEETVNLEEVGKQGEEVVENEPEVSPEDTVTDKSAPNTPETPGTPGPSKGPFGKVTPPRTIKPRKGSDAGSGKEEIKMADRRRLTFPNLKATDQKRNVDSKQAEKKSVVIPGFRLSSVRKAFEASGSPPKQTSKSPPKTVVTRIPMKDIGNGSGLKVDISGRGTQAKDPKAKALDAGAAPEGNATTKKSVSPPKLNRVGSTGTAPKGSPVTTRAGSMGTVCKPDPKAPVRVPPTAAPSGLKPVTVKNIASTTAPKVKTPPTVGLKKPLYGVKKQDSKVTPKPKGTLSRDNSVEEGNGTRQTPDLENTSKVTEQPEIIEQVKEDQVHDEQKDAPVPEVVQEVEGETQKRKVASLEIVLDNAAEEEPKPAPVTKEPPTPHRAEVLVKIGKPEVSVQPKPEADVVTEACVKPGRKMVSYVAAITGSAPSTPPTPPVADGSEDAQSQPRCDASGNWRFGNTQYEKEELEEAEPRGYSVYRSKYRSVHTYRSVVEQHVDAVPERILERSGSVSSTGSASDLDDVFEEFNSDTILLSLLSRTKTLLESLAQRDPIMAVPAASLVARSAGIFSDLRSLGFPGTSIKARITPSSRRRGSAGSADESRAGYEGGWKMGSGSGTWKAASSSGEPFTPDSAGSSSTRKPWTYSRSVSREAEDDVSSASTCKVSATVRSLRSTYSRSYSSELSELEDNCNSKTSMGSSSRLSRQEGYSSSSSRRGETPQQETGSRSRESSIGSESGYGSRVSGRLPGISGVRSASRDRTTTIYATLRDRTSNPSTGTSRPRSVMVGDLFGNDEPSAGCSHDRSRGTLYRDAGLTRSGDSQSSTSPSEDIGIYGTIRDPGRRPPTRYTRSVTKEMAPEERVGSMSRPRSVLVLSEPAAADGGQSEIGTPTPRVVRHYSRSVTRSDNGKEKEEEEEVHLEEEEAGGRRYTSHTHQVLRQESSNGESPSTTSQGGGGGGSDGTATPTDSLETSSVCSDAGGDRESRTDEETVGERIRRKSFFARFNDSRIPRKGRRSGRDVLLEPDPTGWLPPPSPLRTAHFRLTTGLDDDPFTMQTQTQLPPRRTVYCYPSTVELEWSSSHRPTTIRRVTHDLADYPSHSVDEILHPHRAARAHSVPANDVPDGRGEEGQAGVAGGEVHGGLNEGHGPSSTHGSRCSHAAPTVRRHSSMTAPRRPSRLSLVVDDIGDDAGLAAGGSGYASSPEGGNSTRTYMTGPRMRNHAYSSLLMDGMGENHREVIRRAMDLCGSFRY